MKHRPGIWHKGTQSQIIIENDGIVNYYQTYGLGKLYNEGTRDAELLLLCCETDVNQLIRNSKVNGADAISTLLCILANFKRRLEEKPDFEKLIKEYKDNNV